MNVGQLHWQTIMQTHLWEPKEGSWQKTREKKHIEIIKNWSIIQQKRPEIRQSMDTQPKKIYWQSFLLTSCWNSVSPSEPILSTAVRRSRRAREVLPSAVAKRASSRMRRCAGAHPTWAGALDGFGLPTSPWKIRWKNWGADGLQDVSSLFFFQDSKPFTDGKGYVRICSKDPRNILIFCPPCPPSLPSLGSNIMRKIITPCPGNKISHPFQLTFLGVEHLWTLPTFLVA